MKNTKSKNAQKIKNEKINDERKKEKKSNFFYNKKKKRIITDQSGVAQGKRGGLITRRSVDRNHSPLNSFFFSFISISHMKIAFFQIT